MSTLVLTERPRLWDDDGSPSSAPPRENRDWQGRTGGDSALHGPAPSTPPGEGLQPAGPTLADLVASAWEGLSARVTVACPVCHGELEPRPGGGRCRSCGTSLS